MAKSFNLIVKTKIITSSTTSKLLKNVINKDKIDSRDSCEEKKN